VNLFALALVPAWIISFCYRPHFSNGEIIEQKQ